MNSKSFFESYCKVLRIDPKKASRIIDGRYKPYLSALDNMYYDGSNIWEAKLAALQAYEKRYGKDQLADEIIKLK